MRTRSGFLATLVAAFILAAPPATAAGYSDLWWNPSESGWGLSIADHQTNMFAVWYTYRQDGSPTWFVMPGGTWSADHRLFSTDLYETSGPPWSGAFNPSQVVVTKVGTAILDFAPAGLAPGTAIFTYSLGGVSAAKQIQRQPYGNSSPDWGNDLTDLYYDPAESGWGLSVSHHGNNAFAVWYTYDEQRRPLWFVMPGATFASNISFTGDLYTTTGPWYGSEVFDPSRVQVTRVGNAEVEFESESGSSTGMMGQDMAMGTSKSGRLSCHTYFMGCNGKLRGRIGNASIDKWISQQPYGYAAPDTPPRSSCIPYFTTWSACTNGMRSRSIRVYEPQGCFFSGTLELTQACNGSGGASSGYDGTYAGSWDVSVTVYGPDGSVFAMQRQTGTISVVIRNGAVSVNGSPATGSVTSAGGIAFNASGTVGACAYQGSMASTGGAGTVHCSEPGLYLADGSWTLSRTGP